MRIPSHKFSLSTTLQIGIQALEAMQLYHEAGFVHRDIKPVCLFLFDILFSNSSFIRATT